MHRFHPISILVSGLLLIFATQHAIGQLQTVPSQNAVHVSFGDPRTPLVGSNPTPPVWTPGTLIATPGETTDSPPCLSDCRLTDTFENRAVFDIPPANVETVSPVSQIFYGYDSWRGYPDGAWSNNGLHVGFNRGTKLGRWGQRNGIGFQMGASVGVYAWGGTDYRLDNQDQPTTQGFVTYGLFRRADQNRNLSWGVVHDWMINNNYGVLGEDLTLNQWRAQIGYTIDETREIGVWGAWRGSGDTRDVPGIGPQTWQPHNQLNFYMHHKWQESLTDTKIWLGVPERKRLTGDGTLGDWIVGLSSSSPISSRVSIYTMVNYMHQSASPGPAASRDEAWNFHIGMALHPGRLARSRTVNGHKFEPMFRVANNGLFLVDTDRTRLLY